MGVRRGLGNDVVPLSAHPIGIARHFVNWLGRCRCKNRCDGRVRHHERPIRLRPHTVAAPEAVWMRLDRHHVELRAGERRGWCRRSLLAGQRRRGETDRKSDADENAPDHTGPPARLFYAAPPWTPGSLGWLVSTTRSCPKTVSAASSVSSGQICRGSRGWAYFQGLPTEAPHRGGSEAAPPRAPRRHLGQRPRSERSIFIEDLGHLGENGV